MLVPVHQLRFLNQQLLASRRISHVPQRLVLHQVAKRDNRSRWRWIPVEDGLLILVKETIH